VSSSVVATWFYEQDEVEGGAYAQMRGDSSSEAYRDVYRRCLGVFFRTARIANPQAELVLVLNRPWRRDASKVADEVGALFESVRVTTRVCGYTFSPPRTWPQAWRNQFFVLDALGELAAASSSNDSIVLLDCDVVWSCSERTRVLWSELRAARSLTMHMDYAPDQPVNGMARRDMTRLALDLGLETDNHGVLPYCGGELVGLAGGTAAAVYAGARDVWPKIVARHERSELWGMDEAHVLSMLYANLGLTTGNAAPYVKRLWTQPFRYRNTAPGDEDLALWHVPAEKRYGLRRLYDALSRMPDTDAVTWVRPATLGPYLGVPRNTAQKVVRDTASASFSRVRGVLA
jgi:hypothetical protein